MNFKSCYTISNLNSLKELPYLHTAQVTLNSRMFPSKRNTPKLLSDMKSMHDANIILHYDFIYIISRFGMFTDEVQDAIMKEINDLMNYAATDSHIKGIIMHTDFPLKKSVYQKSINSDKLKEEYAGSLWDSDKILEMSSDINSFLFQNINCFYQKFTNKYPADSYPIKIFLENTTKVSTLENHQGTIGSLISYLYAHIDQTKLFGLCYDTEHDYAVTGVYTDTKTIQDLKKDFDLIVHLNCVPASVKPCSCKDRHSDVTIFECTKNHYKFYFDFMKFLETNDILYVREVHTETMKRELDKLIEYE